MDVAVFEATAAVSVARCMIEWVAKCEELDTGRVARLGCGVDVVALVLLMCAMLFLVICLKPLSVFSIY